MQFDIPHSWASMWDSLYMWQGSGHIHHMAKFSASSMGSGLPLGILDIPAVASSSWPIHKTLLPVQWCSVSHSQWTCTPCTYQKFNLQFYPDFCIHHCISTWQIVPFKHFCGLPSQTDILLLTLTHCLSCCSAHLWVIHSLGKTPLSQCIPWHLKDDTGQ